MGGFSGVRVGRDHKCEATLASPLGHVRGKGIDSGRGENGTGALRMQNQVYKNQFGFHKRTRFIRTSLDSIKELLGIIEALLVVGGDGVVSPHQSALLTFFSLAVQKSCFCVISIPISLLKLVFQVSSDISLFASLSFHLISGEQ